MSLVDRTNEEIELTIELPTGTVLVLDADNDSSFNPPHWVWLEVRPGDDEKEARAWHLTYGEAELAWQRLSLILGKSPVVAPTEPAVAVAAGEAFDMLHWGCNNRDHGEAYQKLAVGLGYKDAAAAA